MENLILIHGVFAFISLGLLLTRGLLSAKAIDWRAFKSLKIAPHIVDTVLLVSGIILFVTFGYDFSEHKMWLIPKMLFLVMYIVFAAKAFRKNQPFSLKHYLLSVVCFMLTMMVAIHK